MSINQCKWHEGLQPQSEEKEILKGLADAFTYKKLAEKLFISPHTVRTHIKNIYEKLHVHSLMKAVSKARMERIV